MICAIQLVLTTVEISDQRAYFSDVTFRKLSGGLEVRFIILDDI